jgi:excisionase family DNA binding protein
MNGVQTADPRPLWPVEKAARRCGVPTSTFYEKARRNEIAGVVRIGRRIMVDPDELNAWIKAGGQALPGGWRRESLE